MSHFDAQGTPSASFFDSNIIIIAYMLGGDFSMKTLTSVLFALHYLHINEHVTQLLPLNLPFVNKTQDITGRYN